MAKKKLTKGQLMILITLHIKLKIEQHEPHNNPRENSEIDICCFSSMHTGKKKKGKRAKTSLLGIRIMCQSGATCLYPLLFQSASTINIQLLKRRVGLVQSGPHHNLIENLLVLVMI